MTGLPLRPPAAGPADLPAALADLARLDPASPTPLYVQLRQALRRAIDTGRLKGGQALPGERDLAAGLGLSRATVRQAILALARDGVVTQRQGAGTFIAERLEQPLSVLSGFSDDMRARGLRPGSRVLERVQGRPAPEEAMALDLSPAEPVLRLARVRMADGRPMAIERATVPLRFLPQPALADLSLYRALETTASRPVRALQRLRAGAVAAADALPLGIAEGSPALFIERRSFRADGVPVEFTRSVYRGDRYDFVAEMRIDRGDGRDG